MPSVDAPRRPRHTVPTGYLLFIPAITLATFAAFGLLTACGSRTGLLAFEAEGGSRDQSAPSPDVFVEPPPERDAARDVLILDIDSGDAPHDASLFRPCADGGGAFIYLVGRPLTGHRYHREALYTFDPDTYVLTKVGPLTCPGYGPRGSPAPPYALAIDRERVAYVDSFMDGALFRIDGRTGACTSTAYDTRVQGGSPYAMSFVAGEDGGERLFVATWPGHTGEFSTLDTTTFAVTPLATLAPWLNALSGTGDGRLFAFSPATTSTSAFLYELHPPSASIVHAYPVLESGAGIEVTIAFWKGSVFLFEALTVDKYDLVSQTRSQVATLADVEIYAATTSTCAPPD